jgi:hypothetical protein
MHLAAPRRCYSSTNVIAMPMHGLPPQLLVTNTEEESISKTNCFLNIYFVLKIC